MRSSQVGQGASEPTEHEHEFIEISQYRHGEDVKAPQGYQQDETCDLKGCSSKGRCGEGLYLPYRGKHGESQDDHHI